MNWHRRTQCCAFLGSELVAQASLETVAKICKTALDAGDNRPLLIFNEEDYSPIEVDFRGSPEDVHRALPEEQLPAQPTVEEGKPSGPGRPKLGVVSREVTLLPRHWDWLKAQPGGASVALRKLVEEARKANAGQDEQRQAQNSAYRFMSIMAGAYEGFEEASRALFAEDMDAYIRYSDEWPIDVRTLARKLAARAIPG